VCVCVCVAHMGWTRNALKIVIEELEGDHSIIW
jgi:hypothetical protein